MSHAFVRHLGADARGVTVIEFAMIAPVMLLLIMGLGDLGYKVYVESILVGAIQKSGRDATIQGSGNNVAELDRAVVDAVRDVAPSVTYVSSRKNYSRFADISPERFVDANGNGVYDAATECFTDVNGTKTWDADPGATGQGGANDVTVYTLTIEYPRLFPMYYFLGWSALDTASATTILKNQPYASQNAFAPEKVCPKVGPK